MKNNKKGFAISGILYPLLILTLFLVVQMLFMLQTRKNVLDKSRTELADSINKNNQVYNNEELSTLLDEQKKISEQLKIQLDDLQKNYNTTYDNNGYHLTGGGLKVKKMVYGTYFGNASKYIKIKLSNLNIESYSMILLTLKVYQYESYNTINIGGYLYGPQGVHTPRASHLNKTNVFDTYFGVSKSNGDVYIIIDTKSLPYISVYVNEIAISHNASHDLNNGWDIKSITDISDMTLYKCSIL